MAKRGKLSDGEVQFIEENCGTKTVKEIAKYLDRTPETIKKHIENMSLSYVGMSDKERTETDLRKKLRNRVYWKEVEKQLTENELIYFESIWIDLVQQFREDILPTEELQIKQLITTEILINRSMVERKRCMQEIERLDDFIQEEYARPLGERNSDRIMNLETQLSMARSSQTSYTNEYTKLSNESKALSKDLKATRDQRLKRVEDGKTSWIGLIRMLEDESIREREGRDLELMRVASDKSTEQLSEYHTYEDKIVDMPMLTPDTILKKDKE